MRTEHPLAKREVAGSKPAGATCLRLHATVVGFQDRGWFAAESRRSDCHTHGLEFLVEGIKYPPRGANLRGAGPGRQDLHGREERITALGRRTAQSAPRLLGDRAVPLAA